MNGQTEDFKLQILPKLDHEKSILLFHSRADYHCFRRWGCNTFDLVDHKQFDSNRPVHPTSIYHKKEQYCANRIDQYWFLTWPSNDCSLLPLTKKIPKLFSNHPTVSNNLGVTDCYSLQIAVCGQMLNYTLGHFKKVPTDSVELRQ